MANITREVLINLKHGDQVLENGDVIRRQDKVIEPEVVIRISEKESFDLLARLLGARKPITSALTLSHQDMINTFYSGLCKLFPNGIKVADPQPSIAERWQPLERWLRQSPQLTSRLLEGEWKLAHEQEFSMPSFSVPGIERSLHPDGYHLFSEGWEQVYKGFRLKESHLLPLQAIDIFMQKLGGQQSKQPSPIFDLADDHDQCCFWRQRRVSVGYVAPKPINITPVTDPSPTDCTTCGKFVGRRNALAGQSVCDQCEGEWLFGNMHEEIKEQRANSIQRANQAVHYQDVQACFGAPKPKP